MIVPTFTFVVEAAHSFTLSAVTLVFAAQVTSRLSPGATFLSAALCDQSFTKSKSDEIEALTMVKVLSVSFLIVAAGMIIVPSLLNVAIISASITAFSSSSAKTKDEMPEIPITTATSINTKAARPARNKVLFLAGNAIQHALVVCVFDVCIFDVCMFDVCISDVCVFNACVFDACVLIIYCHPFQLYVRLQLYATLKRLQL